MHSNLSGDSPLSRIANETIKAHTALMDYFLMGAGRSQEKLQQEYSKTTVPKPPSVHLRTLAGWSVRHHWQARIAQQIENDSIIALEQLRVSTSYKPIESVQKSKKVIMFI